MSPQKESIFVCASIQSVRGQTHTLTGIRYLAFLSYSFSLTFILTMDIMRIELLAEGGTHISKGPHVPLCWAVLKTFFLW